MGLNCNVFLITKWKQILSSLIIASTILNVGFMIGWSVEVTHIQVEDAFNQTTVGYEWLVSSGGLASIFFTLGSGYVVETLGPARILHFLLLPLAIAWFVMALSETFALVMVGRIISGGIGYVLIGIVQPLLAEICQTDIRGFLTTLPEFTVSFGMLMMYLFARFLTWQSGTLLAGILTIPMIIAFLFVPESPYWFVRKGNLKGARRSLKKLRCEEHDIEAEVGTIKDAITETQRHQGSFKDQVLALREPANYRPTILLTFIFVFRELGGALVIFNYAAFFFAAATVPLNPFTATVLVGVTRLAFTLVAAFILDKVGRRPLFIASSMICALMMIVCSIALRFLLPSTSWIPLAAVLVYVASYGVGSGPIPWVLLGEMLPTPVRSLSSSIIMCVFCLVIFLLTQFFLDVWALYGLDDIVLGFGIFHLLAGLTYWLFVPETRNRSLEDLQTAFAGANVRPFQGQREGYLQTYGATFPEKARP